MATTRPQLNRINNSFPTPPSMSPGVDEFNSQKLRNWTFRPSPPRDPQITAGTVEVLVSWFAPADQRGADRYRIYMDTPDNLVWQSTDSRARQARIKVPASSTKAFMVSSISNAGRESVKVDVTGSSTDDKYVVDGTTGETGGSEAAPPPEWEDLVGGGLDEEMDEFVIEE